jgi:diguanylate cyclase (GGDEF)-like protein
MIDPTTSQPGLRQLGMFMQQAGMRWMYLLVAVPALSDLVETGRLPATPREWVTEIVAGAVIGVLVHRVRKEHCAVLALSRSDVLTGLWNRRAFEEAVEVECARAERSRQPLCLVYIDVDNFKQVNDRAGHHAGDRVLQQIGAAIRQAIRAHVDRGFRIGGDEFALLLPGSRAAEAEAAVTRISGEGVQSASAWAGEHLGLSAGIVEFNARESANEFVRRADDAMYRSKRSRGQGGIDVR